MIVYRRLIVIALILALAVISLGAYVRLSDAGLGCPDWPGCYGQLTPHHAADEINAELANRPQGPVSHAKAWKEMAHRYLAGLLGLLVVAIAVTSWRQREVSGGSPVLPTLLLGLIVFQALLGMWTVTLLLKPLVVSGHLLGGMATFALLLWLWLRERARFGNAYYARADHLIRVAALGLVLVITQIALGGWVSTNYAALACSDFPQCQGQWLPPMDFEHGFSVYRELGETATGALLPMNALTAIHWTHRLGALIVAGYLIWLATQLFRTPGYRSIGVAIVSLLVLQVGLGIGNVLASLPLALAVAHNTGAALLLASLVVLNYRVRRR
ncbi:MAG: COX15/CtaA family protein [Thiobacillus sp.]